MSKTSISKTTTGTQPSSNRTGLNSASLAPANPRGMSAANPATVIAKGGGGARVSKRKAKRRSRSM